MSRMCSIQLNEGWSSKDHAFFIRLLLSGGVRPDDIKQVDLSGRRGFCRVSFSCTAVRDEVLSRGLEFEGKQLVLVVGDGAVVSVHIFGVADDTPLSAITSAMEKFGSVIGVPKRETKAVEGCTFTTGTTFVNLVPTAIVPSTIMLSESRQKLRVWHRGQVPTCYKCGSSTHIAKLCTHQARRPSPYADAAASALKGTCTQGQAQGTLDDTVGANSEPTVSTSQSASSTASAPETGTPQVSSPSQESAKPDQINKELGTAHCPPDDKGGFMVAKGRKTFRVPKKLVDFSGNELLTDSDMEQEDMVMGNNESNDRHMTVGELTISY